MTVQIKDNLTVARTFTKENEMNLFTTEWQLDLPQRPEPREEHQVVGNDGYNRTIYLLTTDLDSGNDAQNRAAVFGFDLQIQVPRDGLPTTGIALLIGLDELLLDAHGRRKYLAWLKTQTLPMPTVVLSRDFLLDPPTVVRPGLMLAARLDDDVLRTLRHGHIYLPTHEGEGRKAA